MGNETDNVPRDGVDELNERNASSAGTTAFQRPKDIFLFSDGTGNSSAKLFKTNVWRLYEALDLGEPVDENDRVQIAYYDNGVGNSGFRPLAILGGVFGYGLAASVRRLYQFLCRNYQPGDRIHVFGFSRGAFTIRLLIGLIASQGILKYADEHQLGADTTRAWKQFRKTFVVSNFLAGGVARFFKAIMLHSKNAPDVHKNVPITFAGLWDTVAAYGGPIVEITRGIDKWLWPLSLDNQRLSPLVECARHALSIDDQRDAFQPLLWDETGEAGPEKSRPGGLVQVWFSGMHADVGGGYPDETLSYVSLVWVIDELRNHCPDVRLLEPLEDRIRMMSNVYGPIHDSREGPQSYYRFQPRKIAAYVAGDEARTAIYRDPRIREKSATGGLLLEPVKIHQSVFDRIAAGTDGYAPINLPARMTVVSPARASAGQEAMAKFFAKQIDKPDFEKVANLHETLWDHVWRRRALYFLTVAATLALVLLPLWERWQVGHAVLSENVDDRTVTTSLGVLVSKILPGVFTPWIDAAIQYPTWTVALLALLYLLAKLSARVRQTHCDRSSYLWRATFQLPLSRQYHIPAKSGLRKIREHQLYQKSFAALKWTILPNVFGIAMLSSILLMMSVVLVQGILIFKEGGRAFCSGKPVSAAKPFPFSPKSACQQVDFRVTEKNAYVVRISAKEWVDGEAKVADPGGVAAIDQGASGLLGAPFRRLVLAGYLEPVVMIKTADNDVHFQRLRWIVSSNGNAGQWEGKFEARRSGTVSLIVNDAVLPFDPGSLRLFDWQGRYANNSGTSCVSITDANQVDAAAWPEIDTCGRQNTK